MDLVRCRSSDYGTYVLCYLNKYLYVVYCTVLLKFGFGWLADAAKGLVLTSCSGSLVVPEPPLLPEFVLGISPVDRIRALSAGGKEARCFGSTTIS